MHQAHHKLPILIEHGFVEAEAGPDQRHGLLRGLAARDNLRDVMGGNEEKGEDRNCRDPEHDNARDDASD